MAAREKVIDRFVTEYLFREDKTALNRIEKRVGSIRQGLNRTSKGFLVAGAALAAPLAGILRGAYKTDSALRILESRTGATADQLARLKQQAYEVGSKLPLDTADILKAQTAYFQLGNTIEETMEATPTIARLAVSAEGVGVEDAARYLAFAKNNFDLTGEAALVFASRMLKAETITAATARGIGESMQFSAQAASDAGVGGAAYMALLGGIAGAGRDVESVSQGLNVLFTKLARAMSGFGRGGKMVKKAFGGIRIEVEEVRGIMKSGGEDAIFQLLELMGRRAPNQEALTSALATLVGESYASALSFAVKDVDTLREKFQVLKGTGVEEIFRQSGIRMKGLSGAVKLGLAVLDTLINVLADLEIAAPFERAIRTLASWVDWLVKVDAQGRHLRGGTLKLIAQTLKFGVVLIGVGVALRGVSWLLGGYLMALKAARYMVQLNWKETRLYAIWNRIAAAATALSAKAAVAKTAAIARLNRAYFLLTTSMGRAVLMGKLAAGRFALGATAGATLARVLALLAGTFVSLSVAASVAWAAIGGPIGLGIIALAVLIWAAWEPLSTFFAGLWQGLVNGSERVAAAFGRLLDELGPIGEAIRFVFSEIKAAWAGLVTAIGYDATGAGVDVGGWIIDGLVGVIDTITEVIRLWKAMVGLIGGVARLAVPGPRSEATEEGLKSNASTLIDVGGGILSRMAGLLLPPGVKPFWEDQTVPATGPEGIPAAVNPSGETLSPEAMSGSQRDLLTNAPEPPPGPEAAPGGVAPVAGVAPSAPVAGVAGVAPVAPAAAPVIQAAPILPVASPPTASVTQISNQGGARSVTFENEITVNAPGADSQEIAQNVGEEFRDQLHSLVDDADSPFLVS